MVPGVSRNRGKWSTLLFSKIAETIYKKTGWNGIISGTQQEYILGEQIIKQSDVPLQNLLGQITLVDLAGLLSQSRLAISDNTRTTHIAASEETPSVCILGGGYFGGFVPYPKLSGQINPINVVYHKMQCYVCNTECVYPLK